MKIYYKDDGSSSDCDYLILIRMRAYESFDSPVMNYNSLAQHFYH